MRTKAIKIMILMILIILSLKIISSTISDITPDNDAWYGTANVNFTFALTNYTNSTTCSLFVDDTKEQNKTAEDANVFAETLAEGTHTWHVNCSNANSSESIAERTVNVDLSAPIITLSSPEDNANLTNLTNVTFTTTDNLVNSLNCTLTLDESAQSVTATNGTAKTVDIIVDVGTHYWNVTCEDDVGNENTSDTRSFTIENTTTEETTEPFFNITLNKETFNLGQTGALIIDALNGSNITIEIGESDGGWFILGQTITILNGTFPTTEIMTYTNESGNYTANADLTYNGTTISEELEFEVLNSISISVAGDKSVDIDEPTELEAYVTGGIGEYTYLWDLSNGSTSTENTINLTYENPGTYEEELTVTDEEGNTKSTIINVVVKKVYKVIVDVKDSSSDGGVSGANIEMGIKEGKTNSKGQYTFYISRGTYKVTVLKTGYEVYYDELRVRENITYTAEIEKRDIDAPSVELVSPADNEEIAAKNVDIKFKAADQTTATCVLYTAEADDEWYTKSGTKVITDDSEQAFSLVDLDYLEYKWKIECEDLENNDMVTEERTFKIVNETVKQAAQSKSEMTDVLYGVIDTLAAKGLHEQQVIDALDIEKQIRNAVVEIQRAYRDINDLVYNKAISSEKKKEREEELQEKIIDTYESIPVNVKVLENKAFVKYIRDPELKEISENYATIKKYLDKEKFFEASKQTQSKATISTSAKNIELELMDGTKKTVTLVIKEVKYVNSSFRLKVIESIPKELAESTDELTIITNHKILEEDPLIEFDTPQQIVYYFNEKIDLVKVDQTQTALFEDSYTKAVTSITGHSVFDFSTDLDKKGYLVVLIIVLVLIYAGHSHLRLNKMRFFYYVLFGDKKIHTINMLINDALDNLEAHNLEKAHFIYREIKLYYEKISGPSKNEVYPRIKELCSKLDHSYSQTLVSDIEKCINQENIGKARYYYHRLEEVYKRLDKDYKKTVFDQIKTLQVKIAS